MIKLAISGCQGRMGLRIMHLAQEDKNFSIHALMEKPNHPAIKGLVNNVSISADPNCLKGSDVLIEFTTPDTTVQHLEYCRKFGIKLVVGTTGLGEAQIRLLEAASEEIPIVFSSNMSVGVNLLFSLLRDLAERTGPAYKASIVEAHHVHKKDAPSGTAKTLARIIHEVTGQEVGDIESIREGEIIGDHTIKFESQLDTLTIGHHAKTRDIFASGALVAAKFVIRKKNGLFSMEDVLRD